MNNNQLSLFDNKSEYLESNLDNFEEGTASFRVHASLIYKLGESLIADEITALSELIKNSYDADAKICYLNIDTNFKEDINGGTRIGKIELVDDGSGMNLSTIVNGWLTLSNSPKKKMKRDRATTPKFHRFPLGDKGLGRLSVQKLGRYMQMITKSSDSNIEFKVDIPWGDFLKNTTIDQIPVIIHRNILDNDKSYTKIIITDLLNNELWSSKEQIDILGNSINKIVSPFKVNENSFKVVANVNGQVLESVDKVFEDLLSRARARHIISYSKGKSVLKSFFTPSFFYNREMIENILKKQFDINSSVLSDFWSVFHEKLESFQYQGGDKEVFISIDNCLFDDLIPRESGVSLNNNDPGAFSCEIYEYTLDKRFLDNFYQNISYSDLIDQNEYKEFIERFHGIKVVRDGFIVQGFGEGDGGDWLGLSSSSKTKGSFFDFRNDSVIGCVYLTGIENYSLKETTNREGFVEDDYYNEFKRILDDSIRRVNKNRKKLNDFMREYLSKALGMTAGVDRNFTLQSTVGKIRDEINKTEQVTIKGEQKLQKTLESFACVKEEMYNTPFVPNETLSNFDKLYNEIQSLSTDYDMLIKMREQLSRQIEMVSFDFSKLNEQLQDLFELAGLGISVEMFSHEFDSSIRNIRLKNDSIIEKKDKLSINDFINHLYYINFSLDTLRKQMSYFNPGLKFVRAEKQNFSFRNFINEHRTFYKQRCQNTNIDYYIDVRKDFDITMNRGMLNQVFDNLFNNSEYWLNYSLQKGITNNKLFSVVSIEKGIIVVSDNGIGVSQDIETRLFNPFETKKQNGRGLGLYIVANNLKYNSSSIRLLEERNSYGNCFKFEINLTAIAK